MVLTAALSFGLPEITTPVLGAPPLLNQEGSIFIFHGEPEAHDICAGFWRLHYVAHALSGPRTPTVGTVGQMMTPATQAFGGLGPRETLRRCSG